MAGYQKPSVGVEGRTLIKEEEVITSRVHIGGVQQQQQNPLLDCDEVGMIMRPTVTCVLQYADYQHVAFY